MKIKAKRAKNKYLEKKQAKKLNEILEIVNKDFFQLNVKEESSNTNNNQYKNNNEIVKEIILEFAKTKQNNNIIKKVESSKEKNFNNIHQKNNGDNSQNIIITKKIKKNVNNKFLDIVKTNQPISADEINIKNIEKDGNCFYRSIAFFLLGNENYYKEIKELIIQWIEDNYSIYENFFADDDEKNINKAIKAKQEYEYIKSTGYLLLF